MSHVHGTSSTSSSTNSTGITIMMIPYLHFTGGDNLFFKTWHPSSAGAIGGACIGLLFLALIERLLAATRSVFEAHWRQRALVLIDTANGENGCSKKDSKSPFAHSGSEHSVDFDADVADIPQESDPALPRKYASRRARIARTILPFIPAHDIPRGVLHAVQALLGYLLMLAIMTFNAAYIISIIVGLGIGEVLFGRAMNGRSSGSH